MFAKQFSDARLYIQVAPLIMRMPVLPFRYATLRRKTERHQREFSERQNAATDHLLKRATSVPLFELVILRRCRDAQDHALAVKFRAGGDKPLMM